MFLPLLRISELAVSPPLVLAPMSGVTTSAFRRFIRRENPRAVGLVVTEFISVEGLTRANRQSLKMMSFHPEERPIGVQIFGFDIERMVAAARLVQEHGADLVDINCGCPVPKVVRRGGGCELMRQPAHLERLLRELRRAVTVPLTVKIRAGWSDDSKNALEIAKIAEDAGVDALTVHGRTRAQLYRGKADWDLIAQVAQSVKIPVLGSGDVIDAQSARERFATPVAGLMVGRAALLNPWVFSEICAALSGERYQAPLPRATPQAILRYLDLLVEDLPEKAVLGKLKQFASQVARRVRGSAPVRRALCQARTVAEFRAVLAEWDSFLHECQGVLEDPHTSFHDAWAQP